MSNSLLLSFSTPPWQTFLPLETKMEASRELSLILPRLYLTNLFAARDEKQLRALGVTHVVSVIEQKPKFPQRLGLKSLHIPISDNYEANILEYLGTTTEYIKNALEENETNVVLVHCLMGMSRSATVVCAYVMATMSMTSNQAVNFVTDKRPIICPNNSFRLQLDKYGRRFRVKNKDCTTGKLVVSVTKCIRKWKLKGSTPSGEGGGGTIPEPSSGFDLVGQVVEGDKEPEVAVKESFEQSVMREVEAAHGMT